MCLKLNLSQGKVTKIDASRYDELIKYKWHVNLKNGKWYAQRSKHIKLGSKRYTSKTIYLHRELLNAPKGVRVDHINGDTLDNRLENLRLCTQQENTRNTKSRKGSSSKYLGVHLHKQSGKYRAQIKLDGGKKSLGLHSTPEEAALAYNEAALRYFGEFANLNKVGG